MYLSNQLKKICNNVLLGPKNLEKVGKNGPKLVLKLGFISKNLIPQGKQNRH
jgi:hypothetical protein